MMLLPRAVENSTVVDHHRGAGALAVERHRWTISQLQDVGFELSDLGLGGALLERVRSVLTCQLSASMGMGVSLSS
jgi:hypothetical protein